MNKKQYIFLILLSLLLYLSYTIIKYEYKKYAISQYVEEQEILILQIKHEIKKAKEIIVYKNTPSYKNRILKEQQGLKMKGEWVIYLTKETVYNTFKTNHVNSNIKQREAEKPLNITQTMTNLQKWIYFLLKKDTR